MKRLLLTLLPILVAVPAMAFRTSLHRGDRVEVLRPSLVDGRGLEGSVANAVTRGLQRELRVRGIDAIESDFTFEDLQREARGDADYYVEVVSSDADGGPYGGIGVAGRNVGVDISVIVSRVAATLRLYDGRTLELKGEYDMQRRVTAVLPTAIGVGGRHVGLWVALPFVQYARYRAAAQAVAADAAQAIVDGTRGE